MPEAGRDTCAALLCELLVCRGPEAIGGGHIGFRALIQLRLTNQFRYVEMKVRGGNLYGGARVERASTAKWHRPDVSGPLPGEGRRAQHSNRSSAR